MKKKYFIFIGLFVLVIPGFYLFHRIYPVFVLGNTHSFNYLDDYEREITAYKPDPNYPDDIYITAIKEARAAKGKGNGALGVCLVDEKDGKIIETGHNKQFTI